MRPQLTPETQHTIERIAALRAETDHLAQQALNTREHGVTAALARTLNIAPTTVRKRYGQTADRKRET